MASREHELDIAIRAIRQIMGMFLFERILCVICAFCSFCLFLFAAYKLFAVGTPDPKAMGSSSVPAAYPPQRPQG